MEISFAGKRALVTGASGGLGKVVVENLVKSGAEVVAFGFTQSKLDALKAKNPGVEIHRVDLKDWDATKTAAESCGPIDLLVNCAAVCDRDKFGDIQEEAVDRAFSTNLKPVINISQVVAAGMKSRKSGGAIVNVSSIAAKRVLPGTMVYSASKAAMDIITKTMALELGPHKLRVNAVNPGGVNTDVIKDLIKDMKPEDLLTQDSLRKLAEPKEVSDVILYLLSDLAEMVNGVNLKVDGGAYLR